ncbi:oxidoreductase-like protein [Aspergillus crustosus]
MEGYTMPAIRHSLSNLITHSPLPSVRIAFAQNTRRSRHMKCYHAKPDFFNRTGTSQAYPLTGYYSDILSARSAHCGQATSSPVASQQKPIAAPLKSELPDSPEEKMAIVFGTRLAGPGRFSKSSSDAAWRTVNGIPIPPRPEEPDNCCMSGCVHCVWDDYRDEMEEWADMLAQAKVKGSSEIPGIKSMDNDGSSSSWSPGKEDDLFADIPVGIREFMKTEKRLREVRRQEKDGF